MSSDVNDMEGDTTSPATTEEADSVIQTRFAQSHSLNGSASQHSDPCFQMEEAQHCEGEHDIDEAGRAPQRNTSSAAAEANDKKTCGVETPDAAVVTKDNTDDDETVDDAALEISGFTVIMQYLSSLLFFGDVASDINVARSVRTRVFGLLWPSINFIVLPVIINFDKI